MKPQRLIATFRTLLATPLLAQPTLLLGCLILTQTLLVNLLVAAYEQADCAWLFSLFMDRYELAADSWRPMHVAVLTVRADGPQDLYDKVYFASGYQFIYPPQGLACFELLDRLQLVAWSNFSALNRASKLAFGLTGAFSGLLARKLSPAHFRPTVIGALLLGVLAAMTFYPLVRGVELGQVQTWLSLFLVLSICAFAYERKLLAGVLLGLVIVVKPHLGVAVLWALVRREHRLAIGTLLVLAGSTILSLALYGPGLHADYAKLLGFLSTRAEPFYANQSLSGLLHRLAFNGNSLVWDGTHTQAVSLPWVNLLSRVFAGGGVLAALVWRRDQSTFGAAMNFAIILLTATVVSPVAYEHHYGFCLCLFLVLGSRLFAQRRWGTSHWLLMFSYSLSANFFGMTRQLATSNLNLIQSYQFIASVLLLGLVYKLTSERTPLRKDAGAARPNPNSS